MLQGLLDASVQGANRKGGTVVAQRGEFVVTDTIRLKTIDGLRMLGEGKAATVIRWRGPADKPVFLLDDCQHCEFHDFGILFDNPASCAFELVNGVNDPATTQVYIPTQNKFFSIRIGDNSGKVQYCVNAWNRIGQDDNNNDLHEFYRCEFTGYNEAAIRISGGQIHGLYFDHCTLHGRGVAPYGVKCDYGAFFTWRGGTGGHHSEFDFQLSNFLNKVLIEDWNSEGSHGLVEGLSSKWEAPPLVIRNCRFDGHSTKNYVIAGRNLGNLLVESCTFQPLDGRPRIHYATLGGNTAGQLTVKCNEISTRDQAPYSKADPFVVADRRVYAVHYAGNVFRDLVRGTVTIGDQDESRDGLAVANRQQAGVVTPTAQVFAGDKTFASSMNALASITIRSDHPDGRMSIAGNGKGLTLYHDNNIAEFYPPNLDLRLPANVTIYSGSAFGCTQPAYAGGSKQLKIVAGTEWVDVYSMSYASANYPGIRYAAPKFAWHLSPGAWPSQGGSGPRAMYLDSAGFHVNVPLFVNGVRVGT